MIRAVALLIVIAAVSVGLAAPVAAQSGPEGRIPERFAMCAVPEVKITESTTTDNIVNRD